MNKRDGLHSRSRSRDRRSNHDNDEAQNGDARRVARDNRAEPRVQSNGADGGNNLYITNLSFQTTEESLRAFFEVLGEVNNASVVREPQTQSSRGFGFVSFVDYAHSERAVLELNGRELDSRTIRVEKARRANGYEKTPGRYLGPPQVSAKFGGSHMGGGGGGGREAVRGGGDRMGGGNGYGVDRMGGERSNANDRYPPSYEKTGYQQRAPPRGDDRGYGGGGGYDRPAPMYREDRRERERDTLREASREPQRYDVRGRQRSPPQTAYYDEKRGGGGGGGDAYDDRRQAPASSTRGLREDYAPRSYSRPRDDVRRGEAPISSDRGGSYGGYGGGSYDSRSSGGGYETRGGSMSYDNRPPSRGRY